MRKQALLLISTGCFCSHQSVSVKLDLLLSELPSTVSTLNTTSFNFALKIH